MAPKAPSRNGGGRALEDVRVLALEASVSAPHCTRLLADMGAEVIKIEKPGEGDLVRHWDSVVHGLSSGYVWLNAGKQSVAIDIKKPAGAEAILRLVDRSDVVIENFAPGVMDRLGFGAETLTGRNARLIYCSLSGYGHDGPYRDRKAYDLLIQGEAGIIATTGSPEQPAKVGVPITDLAASMCALSAILTALYQRERTGRGQILDIAMFDAAVSWLAYFPYHYWHDGEEPDRVGMRHHYIAPYGPYLAADRIYVSVVVSTANDWLLFCRDVIRRPDLLDDERFRSAETRRRHRDDLERVIEQIFLELPHDEWVRRLHASGLPYGQVNGIGDVLAHPQTVARQLVREVASPVGPVPIIASPLRLSASPVQFGPIPALGEQTVAVLRSLGYSDREIEALRAAKVF